MALVAITNGLTVKTAPGYGGYQQATCLITCLERVSLNKREALKLAKILTQFGEKDA